METVTEAIAQVWLPEAVEQWFAEKADDAISEALKDSWEGGKPPEAGQVIVQVLGTYPSELTEAAFREFWAYVPPELIQSIKDEIHDIALDLSEDAKHGGRNSLRWHGLTASMFGGV